MFLIMNIKPYNFLEDNYYFLCVCVLLYSLSVKTMLYLYNISIIIVLSASFLFWQSLHFNCLMFCHVFYIWKWCVFLTIIFNAFYNFSKSRLKGNISQSSPLIRQTKRHKSNPFKGLLVLEKQFVTY